MILLTTDEVHDILDKVIIKCGGVRAISDEVLANAINEKLEEKQDPD